MKAVRKVKKREGVEICDIAMPVLGDEQVLVKILASALCKSDLDVVKYTESFKLSNTPVPFTMGHEFCGEVVEIGKSITGFNVGDHVCGETHVPCDSCRTCKDGRRHICPNMGLIGRTVNGCFAEYMVVPAVSAVKIPKSIPAEEAALFEPFGVAVHAVQEAEVGGKTIMVTGTGTIGSMVVECAIALGANKVIVTSRSKEKIENALKNGADYCVNTSVENMYEKVMQITMGRGVDCVIEMTGKLDIFNNAIDCITPGGEIICVGNHNEPLEIKDFTGRIMYREITIKGIFGRRMFDTWNLASDLVESKKVNLKKYIGAKMKLDSFEEGVSNFDKVFGRIVFI